MIAAFLAVAALAHPAPTPSAALPSSVYKARRDRVLQELGNCVAVLASQGAATGLTEDFRQDGDFLWLTGVEEPQAFLVLAPRETYSRVALFLRSRDPEAERWFGPREPISPALKEKLAVDSIGRGEPRAALAAAAEHTDCVAVIAPPHPKALGRDEHDRVDAEMSQRLAAQFGLKLVYKRGLLARLRAAHGPEELERLDRAARIARAGHDAAARATVAGRSELDVRTQIEAAFYAAGATGLAYNTIVGTGFNSTVLHWDKVQHTLRDGDLVVVDAGADFGRYASDVTRTFPVSGRFTEEQAKAYRAVYQAQEDILAAIKPGVSMNDLQRVSEASLRKSGYLEFFIHKFGHYLGLDVHDPGDLAAPIPVGAVITVEPGVYLPERGFGVRIEDEVEITPKGYRLLTSDLPRKLEDVEAWVARARRDK